jgi:hypothetical protein
LFLSAGAQNNHEQLLQVYRWFSGHVSVLAGGREQRAQSPPRFSQDPASLEQLRRYLNKADLGVVDVVFENQLRRQYTLASLGASEPKVVPELKLLHQVGNKTIPFEREQESGGTLAYLDLLGPVAEKLATGGLLCIHELDASLHPLLATSRCKMACVDGLIPFQRVPAEKESAVFRLIRKLRAAEGFGP